MRVLRSTLLLVSALLIGGVGFAAPVSAGDHPAAPADSNQQGVVVTGAETQFGRVLFTADGRALYVYSFQAVMPCGFKPVPCASAWPPLLAAGPSGPFDAREGVQPEHLGTIPITLADGSTGYQVTYFDQPLYQFVKDLGTPGATNGEDVGAFNSYWHLLSVTGQPDAGRATVQVEASSKGPVLSTPTAFSTQGGGTPPAQALHHPLRLVQPPGV